MRIWHLFAPLIALTFLPGCEGCDFLWLEEVPLPRDRGPVFVDAGPVDEGSRDAGSRADAGGRDEGMTDAGAADAGPDPCQDVAGNLPAPRWSDVYPFDRDEVGLPTGLGYDAYWIVGETYATLATGFIGRMTHPELAPAERHAQLTRGLLHTVELSTGATRSMSTVRADLVWNRFLPRPRGPAAAFITGFGSGALLLPSGVAFPLAAPWFTPFTFLVHADGAIARPLWQVRFPIPQPDGIDAVGRAQLAVREGGSYASMFSYRGANPQLERLGGDGQVEAVQPLPNAVDEMHTLLGLHESNGDVTQQRAFRSVLEASLLPLDDGLLLFLTTDDGEFVYGDESITIPEGATRALVRLDAALELLWLHPVGGNAWLDDWIAVEQGRSCAHLPQDGARFLSAAGPVELPGFDVGTAGAYVVCFDEAGLYVGSARIELGGVYPEWPERRQVATLDHLAGGVGLSAGFYGALRVDDGRGGVVELTAAGGLEDLDGVLVRFDGNARFVEARHLATPYDAYVRAMAEVGEDILVVGGFRECLPLRDRGGGIEVIRKTHSGIEGFDGFIARFPNLLRPVQ